MYKEVIENEIPEIDKVLPEGEPDKCPRCARRLLRFFSGEVEKKKSCPVCGYGRFLEDDHVFLGTGTLCYMFLGSTLVLDGYSGQAGVEMLQKFTEKYGEDMFFAWYTKNSKKGFKRIFIKGNLEIATEAIKQSLKYNDLQDRMVSPVTRIPRDELLNLMRLFNPDFPGMLADVHIKGKDHSKKYRSTPELEESLRDT